MPGRVHPAEVAMQPAPRGATVDRVTGQAALTKLRRRDRSALPFGNPRNPPKDCHRVWRDRYVMTVSVPSSSEIATSRE